MKVFWESVFKKNPVLVLAMGLVPAVAITTTAHNGWVLGISITAVLLASSIINYVLVPLVPSTSRVALRVLVLIVLVVACMDSWCINVPTRCRIRCLFPSWWLTPFAQSPKPTNLGQLSRGTGQGVAYRALC